jgi:anti-sigma28 factor (negative regulator of flagellin synthesis)
MPEVPHIGSGLASVVNRGHDSKALSAHTGRASIMERPNAHDRVEISASAHRLERTIEAKDVRAALVERIRQQIADGTYESEQRLTDATERLLRELEA